jgi:hypothetical protein
MMGPFLFFRDFKIQIMTSPTNLKERKLLGTKQSNIHPFYTETSGENDIALIKMANTLASSEFTVPACLWFNTTHLPVKLKKMMFRGSGMNGMMVFQ